ncbi:MAG TPA: MarR family transcriptional regulator [Selenomonadales bacterium]|nr:MarR family transcriptional regulator [Selenomonadales bacterium]
MLEVFDSLCVLLSKAEQKHYLFTKKLLVNAKLGITPGQMTVLYALYKKDGIPITELGKKVFLDNSTLTGLIDRMEKSDLVHRTSIPEDRRCYCIHLTEKANTLRGPVHEIMAQVEKDITVGCDQSEVTTFRKVLEHIYTTL